MNSTVARLATQALLGRRRFLLLLVIPLVLIALAIVVRALAGEGEGYEGIVSGIGLTLVVPLVALLATTSVLGPEVDDGSIVYLLAKPVNRYTVGVSKYVVALLATWVFACVPLFVTGVILDSSDPGLSLAWMVGSMVAAAAYSALFLAMASITRHAVVIGLLFVFLWEGLLGGLLTGVKWISIGAWGRAVADSVSDAVSLFRVESTGLPYALVATALVVAAGLWFTGDRLRSFSMRGET